MKKTVFSPLRFALALLLISSANVVTMAQKVEKSTQSKENNDVHVQIIERNGNEVRQLERTYRLNGMDDPKRDKLVMKLVDSLKATRKNGGRRQLTIIIDDNNRETRIARQPNRLGKKLPNELYVERNRIPKYNFEFRDNQGFRNEFRWNSDSLADQVRRFRMQIPRDFDQQIARPFEDWARNVGGKPSTIRGLEAFPNNPDREQLNVRFSAPTKGDVTILVTNTKGKEVARREIKDFSGEFVGQIDLGKKSQGAYFITVTQNEDGAVKRVVIE